MGFFDLFLPSVKEEDTAAFDCVEWHPTWESKAKKTVDKSYGGRAPCMFLRIRNTTSRRVVVLLRNDTEHEYWTKDVSVPPGEDVEAACPYVYRQKDLRVQCELDRGLYEFTVGLCVGDRDTMEVTDASLLFCHEGKFQPWGGFIREGPPLPS